MNNFFQFITYILFGKRWILWDMKQGYKTTLFVNEVEIDMQKEKMRNAQLTKENLEIDLAELEETELNVLSESEYESPKAFYDAKKLAENERAEQIATFKNRIKSAETDIQVADGELNRIYAITYNNRLKWDYIKNYKIKRTYADDNK